MDGLSLAHSRYNCTYHIVFIPKYRRRAIYGVLKDNKANESIRQMLKTHRLLFDVIGR